MIVTGSPVTAFADAFKAVLVADAALVALIGTRVYGATPKGAQVTYPFLGMGRTSDDGSSGAMQRPGGIVTLHLDGWSSKSGPHEMEQILSRVRALMERRQFFTVPGFHAFDMGLHCEFQEIFDEPDEDSPDRRLWHGVQRWSLEIHEA